MGVQKEGDTKECGEHGEEEHEEHDAIEDYPLPHGGILEQFPMDIFDFPVAPQPSPQIAQEPYQPQFQDPNQNFFEANQQFPQPPSQPPSQPLSQQLNILIPAPETHVPSTYSNLLGINPHDSNTFAQDFPSTSQIPCNQNPQPEQQEHSCAQNFPSAEQQIPPCCQENVQEGQLQMPHSSQSHSPESVPQEPPEDNAEGDENANIDDSNSEENDNQNSSNNEKLSGQKIKTEDIMMIPVKKQFKRVDSLYYGQYHSQEPDSSWLSFPEANFDVSNLRQARSSEAFSNWNSSRQSTISQLDFSVRNPHQSYIENSSIRKPSHYVRFSHLDFNLSFPQPDIYNIGDAQTNIHNLVFPQLDPRQLSNQILTYNFQPFIEILTPKHEFAAGAAVAVAPTGEILVNTVQGIQNNVQRPLPFEDMAYITTIPSIQNSTSKWNSSQNREFFYPKNKKKYGYISENLQKLQKMIHNLQIALKENSQKIFQTPKHSEEHLGTILPLLSKDKSNLRTDLQRFYGLLQLRQNYAELDQMKEEFREFEILKEDQICRNLEKIFSDIELIRQCNKDVEEMYKQLEKLFDMTPDDIKIIQNLQKSFNKLQSEVQEAIYPKEENYNKAY